MRRSVHSVTGRAIFRQIAGRSPRFCGNTMNPKPRVRVAMQVHKPRLAIEATLVAVGGATAVAIAVETADAVTGAEGEEIPLELLIM